MTRAAIAAAAAFATLLATAPAALADDPGPLVPRELASLRAADRALVRLERGDTAAEARVRAAGGRLVARELGIWSLGGASAARLVPPLALAGSLLDAEPVQPRALLTHLEQGDPLLPQQWWLAHIGAAELEPPVSGKPVTIVDTGLDTSHPEFATRPGTRVLNEQRIVGRDDGHGTAVASVLAAPANGVGVVGLYPEANLGVWDASPVGELGSAEVIAGIALAASSGPGVINLSIGGPAQSRLETLAVDYAVLRGSLVVAAAGNDRQEGDPPNYPASLPHVLTVGASDEADGVAGFSSTSAGMDLVAPGVNIPTAFPVRPGTSGYAVFEGTSFSTPVVSAAAAWVWTLRPELDALQLFEVMRRSARDLGAPGRERDSGFGLLDLPAALAAPVPPKDFQEPNETVDHVRPNGLLKNGRAPLTTPARRTNSVSAQLDGADDPRDVYRAWVPARSRLIATPTGPVKVQLLGPSRAGTRLVRVGPRYEVRNTTRTGGYVNLGVTPTARGPVLVSYRLGLTTARVAR